MIHAYIDKLPETKSSRHNRVAYTPCESAPGAGVLTIGTDRGATEYALVEQDTDWSGRSFALVKIGADGDEPEQYSVFCGLPHMLCDCRGFERWGGCKHVEAVVALVKNGAV